MRTSLEHVLLAAIAVAIVIVGTLIAFFGGSGNDTDDGAQTKAQVTRAVQQISQNRFDVSLRNVVVGRAFDGQHWDFRGIAIESQTSMPAFGIVQLTCNDTGPRSRCWNLIDLTVDGRSLTRSSDAARDYDTLGNQGSDTPQPAPATEPLRSSAAPSGPAPTAAQPAASPAPAANSASTTAGNDSGAPTYAVTGNAVNGRAGPGTTYDIVLRLGPAHRLRAVEIVNGWGRYVVAQPAEDAGQTVWIWSDLVTEQK